MLVGHSTTLPAARRRSRPAIRLSNEPGFLQQLDRPVPHPAISKPREDCATANCRWAGE
jgi:hypothetical protein